MLGGKEPEGVILPGEEEIPVIHTVDGCFKNKPAQTKNALDNIFSSLLKKVAVGNYRGAISSLLNDVRAKADGAVGGSPLNDWIIDYAAQRQMCRMIDDMVEYLRLLKP